MNHATLCNLKPYRNWESLGIMAALMGGSGLLGGAWFDSHYLLPGHSFAQHVWNAIQDPNGYWAWCKPWLAQIISFWLTPAMLAAIGVYGAWLSFGQLIDPIRHVRGRRLFHGEEAIRIAKKESESSAKAKPGLVLIENVYTISFKKMLQGIWLVGAPGGGKTVVVNWIVKSCTKMGYKTIIFDPVKGDFSRWVRMTGGRIMIFSSTDSRTLNWHLGSDLLDAPSADAVSIGIIEQGQGDPMWTNSARQILAGLIVYCQKKYGRDWSWAELSEALRAPITEMYTMLKTAESPAAEMFADPDSKTAGSILINVLAFTAPVHTLARAWARCHASRRFSWREWLLDDHAKDKNIVIQIDQGDPVTGRGLARAIIEFQTNFISSMSFPENPDRIPIATVIDELPQLGNVSSLKKINEVARSKNCFVVAACQDSSQIVELYGQQYLKSLEAMFATKIFPQVQGADAQTWVSKQVGEREVQYRTKSVSGTGNGKASVSSSWSQPTRVPVILENELAQFGLRADGKGIDALVLGHGKDALSLTFPFPKPKIKNLRLPHVPWPKAAATTLPVAAPTLRANQAELGNLTSSGLVHPEIKNDQETVEDLNSTILAMFNEIVSEPTIELEITEASATREQLVGDPLDEVERAIADQEGEAEYIPIETGRKQRKRRKYTSRVEASA